MSGFGFTKKGLVKAAVIAAGVLSFGLAQATPITYVFTGQASGVLDTRTGTPAGVDVLRFDNAAYTLTATADTDGVTAWPSAPTDIFLNQNVSAVISVAGLGSMTLTNPGYVMEFRSGQSITFGPAAASPVLGGQTPLALTYDLISPVTSTPLSGAAFSGGAPTDRGFLLFQSVYGQAFSASTSSVPVPGSLALAALPLLALLRREGRKSSPVPA